ncbi:MAG: hypothetical protein KC708_15255 [Anaerolineae bacterium]|nr:hypothetical protein [Anaerolineae bacterium]
MKEKPSPPSMARVALQDTIAVIAGMIGGIALVVLIIVFLTTPENERYDDFGQVMGVLSGIVVVCVIILIWRVPLKLRQLHAQWQRGVMGKAAVTSLDDIGVGRYRRRYLRYAFDYKGSTYKQSIMVGQNWRPRSQELDVLIDPEHPEKSILLLKYL